MRLWFLVVGSLLLLGCSTEPDAPPPVENTSTPAPSSEPPGALLKPAEPL